MADNQLPAHTFWQQRVDKERRALNKHLHQQFKRFGGRQPAVEEDSLYDPQANVAPLHDLHRTLSAPLLPKAAILGAEAATVLPKIVDSRVRTGTSRGSSFPVCEQCGGLVQMERCEECGGFLRPETGARSLMRSRRSASATQLVTGGQGRDLATASQRSSLRSSLTGLTTASLRREVAEAVQQEVAKVVQPLKERLQCEQSTRQRLEEMLRAAKGLRAEA